MKNQYFGDIGDFGKYGLIRSLKKAFPQMDIGINWYLTENDVKTDGKHIDYLLKTTELRKCDTELYDFLKECILNNRRNISEIENSDYLKNTIFYSQSLDYSRQNREERLKNRHSWFNDSIIELQGAKIIYVDPDNGIEVKSQHIGGPNGNKYISYEEISQYFSLGHSLIVYNHRDRKPHDVYLNRFKMIQNSLDTQLFYLRFSRYSVRDYLFVLQDNIFSDITNFLNDFVVSSWSSCFTINSVNS